MDDNYRALQKEFENYKGWVGFGILAIGVIWASGIDPLLIVSIVGLLIFAIVFGFVAWKVLGAIWQKVK